MTAAVYAARKRVDLLLISHDLGGQASWSWNVENYMGFSYIKGVDLMHRFEEHMREFGFPVEYTMVTQVEKRNGGFLVHKEKGAPERALSIIVASGKSPRRLEVPGEERLIGRGVSYCATCDAPIFRGMDVAVVGGGNSALSAAIQLTNYAKSISVVSIADWTGDPVLRDTLMSAENVTAYKYCDVVEITGELLVSGIRVRSRRDGRETIVPVKGVFVEIGQRPNSSIVRGLADLNEAGEIIADCSCKTNVPGLFAAGDVTTVPEKQIIVAAGEGAKAALSAYDYIIRYRGSAQQAA